MANWTFEITTGKWYDLDGKFVSKGYAGGNCGKNKEGIDNPAMEDKPDIGPLPEGWYTFGEVIMESHLGKYAIPLMPDEDNVMYGRKDFYLHGDTTPPGNASEGCIVQPYTTRYTAYTSDCKRVHVVAMFTPEEP
jgi:hypothetical protein